MRKPIDEGQRPKERGYTPEKMAARQMHYAISAHLLFPFAAAVNRTDLAPRNGLANILPDALPAAGLR
jgi:hypothetical protein